MAMRSATLEKMIRGDAIPKPQLPTVWLANSLDAEMVIGIWQQMRNATPKAKIQDFVMARTAKCQYAEMELQISRQENHATLEKEWQILQGAMDQIVPCLCAVTDTQITQLERNAITLVVVTRSNAMATTAAPMALEVANHRNVAMGT